MACRVLRPQALDRLPVRLLLEIPIDRLKHYGVHTAALLLGPLLERLLLVVAQSEIHSHTKTVPLLGPEWYYAVTGRNRVVTHAPTSATAVIAT